MKKSIVSRILDLLFPPKCAACDEVVGAHEALCPRCLSKYESERKIKCPVCKKTAQGCKCEIPREIQTFICSAFYTHYSYDSKRVTEKIIFGLKRKKSSRLAEFFGREAAAATMRHVLQNQIATDDCVITYPPRSEKSMTKYGFDHAERVAEYISHYTGIKLVRALERVGGDEQKTLDVTGRLANAKASLKLSKVADVRDKTVFLFDDVMTTGATLITSSELL